MTTFSRELAQRLSPAELCRHLGWGVGTRLEGDAGYGPDIIEITAVGEHHVLARRLTGRCRSEISWVFAYRDWKQVTG
jgi:hypothetical protein